MKHSFLNKLLSNDTYVNDNTQITSIIDNILFLGSQYSTNYDTLTNHNIKCIISIGCEPLIINNYKLYKFDIEDNGGETEKLFNEVIPNVHEIINECIKNNEPLLVHCKVGASRSAIAIISWLMKYRQMSYENAYTYVKHRRPIVSPNVHFIDYIKNDYIK